MSSRLNAFDTAKDYVPGHVVSYLGTAYFNILANRGALPTDTTYWTAWTGIADKNILLDNHVGPELVVNGAFTTDVSWTKGTGWTISGGQALKASGANTAALSPSTDLVPVIGNVYRLSYDVASYVSGNVVASFGGATGATVAANTTTHVEYLLAADATSDLTFTPATSTALRIDNVSLKVVGSAGADRITVWVEDEAGVAGTASLYVRNEAGNVWKFGTPTTLTAAITTITHTAPGTPDYAIQQLVANTGFGFVTEDEGETVLKVIANLQARLLVVEAAFTAMKGNQV